MRVILSIFLFLSAQSFASSIAYIKPGARVGDVLQYVAVSSSHKSAPYWRASYMRYTMPDEVFEAQRDFLVSRLGEQSEISKRLRLVSMNRRIMMPLDLDFVRLDIKNNPLIDKPVQLVINIKPDDVYLLSDASWSSLPFEAATIAGDIVPTKTKTDSVYVISPSGDVQFHGVAAFNSSKQFVPRGALIYVPSHKLTALQNQQVAQLMANGGWL